MLKKNILSFTIFSFFVGIHSMYAIRKPQILQTKIEALKAYGEYEFAQTILYKFQSDTAKSAERKQALKEKAQDSIDELEEIQNYLLDKAALVKKEKRSLQSGYGILIPQLITNTQNIIKGYIEMAESVMNNVPD